MTKTSLEEGYNQRVTGVLSESFGFSLRLSPCIKDYNYEIIQSFFAIILCNPRSNPLPPSRKPNTMVYFLRFTVYCTLSKKVPTTSLTSASVSKSTWSKFLKFSLNTPSFMFCKRPVAVNVNC